MTKDEALTMCLEYIETDKHERKYVRHAIKAALEQPVQEPLEYWNAVEGWVKIDEVREHFEAVNCGTIYKHGGEGRVPLYTAPPQREWVGLTEFQFAEIYNKWNDTNGSTPWGLYHAIEKALKAKNHG